MDKVKRVINCVVPVSACNLRCHYCYVSQQYGHSERNGQIKNLPFDNQYISDALSVERLGGSCFINLSGMGETLLAPYVIGLSELLLAQGHYVGIVTNGTVKRIESLLEFPYELRKRLFIKFSFHYLELKRLNLLNAFFNNVKITKRAGIAFTVELVANDETLTAINEIKMLCIQETGALCHIIEARDNNSPVMDRLTRQPLDVHMQSWSSFDSELFNLQKAVWGIKRTEFCYAGDWILNLYLETGAVTPCLGGGNVIMNIYDNPKAPLIVAAIGANCVWPHCFGSHVMLTFNTIPDIEASCYTKVRNRVQANGDEWLSPKVKAFFNSTLKESNRQYSKDKKQFINALMSLEYNQEKKYDIIELGRIVEKSLTADSISSIALIGNDKLKNWITDILSNTKIKVKYFIKSGFNLQLDTKFHVRLKRKFKYYIKYLLEDKHKPVELNINDRCPRVDVVIILDYFEYDKIKASLLRYKNLRTLSILELIE